jgi:hypothetical protein
VGEAGELERLADPEVQATDHENEGDQGDKTSP